MDDFDSEVLAGEFLKNLSSSQERIGSDYMEISHDDIFDTDYDDENFY